MKKIFLIVVVFALLASCVSVNKYNRNLEKQRTVNQLKSDVDFVYRKLQQLHPRLYWYISKAELDFKFDSLKASIHTPMTSPEFYLKLSPVISSIKEGHARLLPMIKRLKTKDELVAKKFGATPLSLFEFERFGQSLYVERNHSAEKSIRPGTELLSVNGTSPEDLIAKYRKTFTSDGYNKTFFNRRFGRDFPSYYYWQNGIQDSVSCQFRYNDTIRTVSLKRKPAVIPIKNQKAGKQTLEQKEKARLDSQKRRIQGYTKLTEAYSKDLQFLVPDSSVALMRIRDFTKGQYKKFYTLAFKQLGAAKTKTLILDLRDNPGGRLADAADLYGYLASDNSLFVSKSELTSKTSLWHLSDFRGKSLFDKVFYVAFTPVCLPFMAYFFLSTHKGDQDKFYHSLSASKSPRPEPSKFSGKIYTLINGGSFSASCILSSNLMGSQRSVFVGEETGGAYNGTVAGFMPIRTLPKSKLKIKFGLMLINTPFSDNKDGRGIFPDVAIKPGLDDRIKGNDPELKWVLDDIKGIH